MGLRLTCALCSIAAFAGGQSKPSELWRKDLAVVAEQLPKLHPNLFHAVSREAWEEQVETLDAKLASGQTLPQFVVGMMRLIASVRDGHTFFGWHQVGFRQVPVSMYELADGVFLLNYPKDKPRLHQARVVSIGGKKLADALALLDPIVSADTETYLRKARLQLAAFPQIWQGLGIGDGKRLRLGLVDAKGEAFEEVLDALEPKELRRVRRSVSFDEMSDCWKRRRESFWFRYLPDDKAVWLWYRRCADARGFRKVLKEMRAAVEGKPVEALIVDMRANGGGNSMIIAPLFSWIVRRRLRGKVYAIVGRSTFSSAMMNADQLQRVYKAKTVGEAIGGKPGHFGEVRQLKLPESRLRIFHSTKDFGTKERKGLLPIDVRVDLTSRDVFRGHDAFLEAALREVRKAR